MSLGEIIAREQMAAEICRKRAEAAETEELKHDLAWSAAEHSEIVRCMQELQRYRRTRLTPEMQLTVDCATQHIREFLEQSTKGEVADLGKVCGSNCEVWRAGRCINFDWIKNLDPIMSKSGVKVSLNKAGKSTMNEEKVCDFCKGTEYENAYGEIKIGKIGNSKTIKCKLNKCHPYARCCNKNMGVELEMKIEFCPMCGRRLEEENNGSTEM